MMLLRCKRVINLFKNSVEDRGRSQRGQEVRRMLEKKNAGVQEEYVQSLTNCTPTEQFNKI